MVNRTSQRAILSLIVILGLLTPTAWAADRGQELRDAALAGELAKVRQLLDAGVPVDAAGRYGQTALYFAAGKGHLGVVQLLVEHGADVNARDRFFDVSPLEAALGGGHREVAHFLLGKGGGDATVALAQAVEWNDLDLARAALASGGIEPLEITAVRREAEKREGAAAMTELLAEVVVPRPERRPYAATPERLAAVAGRYRGGEDLEATVTVRDGGVVLHLKEGPDTLPEIPLKAVAEDRFETAQGDMAARFGGRGGAVEWLRVNRRGVVAFLGAVTADPQPLPVAREAPAVEEAPVPAGAPRPWPQFRGPGASGVGDGQGAPAAWSVPEGKNVRFKTPIPGLALSSPVVWGDRIFLTTAVGAKGDRTIRTGLYGDPDSVDDTSEHSFRLFAVSSKDGEILWEREVYRGAPKVRRHLKSSLANASPATDGQRVVVLFGAVGLLAAYDRQGELLWKRDVGVLDCNDPQSGTAEWGHASSPVIYDDLVVIQGDRREDSFLAAYRLADGEPVWRVPRDEPSTWSTPNILPGPGGDELITNGRVIRAYDPRTGKLLWTLGPNSDVVVATPVVGEGMAFVTAGYPPVRPIYAIRPGGRGDLTLAEGRAGSDTIAWSHRRGGTYIPSPVLYRGHLYLLNNNGILSCYRVRDGEQVYQTRVGPQGTSFAASPVAADGRLYLASEDGLVFVLRAGPEYELLRTNPMDEVVMATPAISGGAMFVRTLGHLVGLAATPAGTAP
jgi:outer membrane protein assembly factor BamB